MFGLLFPVVSGLAERLDDEPGNQRRLLVGGEVTRPRDRDHAHPGARLERAPFVIGDPAVAAFAVDHPGRHAGLTETCSDGTVAVQVPQVTVCAADDVRVVLPQVCRERIAAIRG
jgi:hypothetical protein